MKFEIVSRGVSKEEKWTNYQEGSCHHNQQGPRKDGSIADTWPLLGERRVQRGMVVGILHVSA